MNRPFGHYTIFSSRLYKFCCTWSSSVLQCRYIALLCDTHAMQLQCTPALTEAAVLLLISWTPGEKAFTEASEPTCWYIPGRNSPAFIFSPASSPLQHFLQSRSTVFWHEHELCEGECLCVTGSAPCLNWSCGSVVQGWGCLVAGRWPCHYSSDSTGSFLAWIAEPALPWIYSDLPWAEDFWQSEEGGRGAQVKVVDMWVCVTSAYKHYATNWLQRHTRVWVGAQVSDLLCVLQTAG